ncbi:disulfide bond formation protein B [Chlamydiales bacterium]|nr:disulfide bond formation protein B [Chlamydiales bacterium]
MNERFLNAFLIFILSGVLLSAFGVQIFENEEPCPLCFLQRLGMLGVAAGALLNIRFGVSNFHYGVCFLSILFGGFTALRQISLHICPGFPTFGIPVLGLSLYTWSFLVFVCAFIYITLCMMFFDETTRTKPENLSWWGVLAFSLVLFIALGNILTAFIECGLGPCV